MRRAPARSRDVGHPSSRHTPGPQAWERYHSETVMRHWDEGVTWVPWGGGCRGALRDEPDRQLDHRGVVRRPVQPPYQQLSGPSAELDRVVVDEGEPHGHEVRGVEVVEACDAGRVEVVALPERMQERDRVAVVGREHRGRWLTASEQAASGVERGRRGRADADQGVVRLDARLVEGPPEAFEAAFAGGHRHAEPEER